VGELPAIAVVTPSYNQAAYLERTMRSVLGQGYPRLEYAVMDGGSEDGSAGIIGRHAGRLAYWESGADGGQSDAIARGFGRVGGEIMGYLNSDDMLMPGALRYVGEYFAGHPEVDAVYGHRVIVDGDDLEIGRWVMPPHDPEMLRYIDFVPQETLFWRRSLYERVGGIDPSFRFAMDWDLLLKFQNAGARIVRLPYYLGYFRAHGGQKSQTIHGDVGAEEGLRLMGREHPGGYDERSLWRLHARTCRSAIVHAIMLDWGIRR